MRCEERCGDRVKKDEEGERREVKRGDEEMRREEERKTRERVCMRE